VQLLHLLSLYKERSQSREDTIAAACILFSSISRKTKEASQLELPLKSWLAT
jgi:hypothetical protein